MLRAYRAVTAVTFWEALRQPAYWVLLIAGVIVLLLLPFVSLFAAGQERVFLMQLGLGTATLISLLTALVCAANVITREIESKTVQTLLAKPVSRATVILGKYTGVALVLLFMNVALYLLLVVAVAIQMTNEQTAASYEELFGGAFETSFADFAIPIAGGIYACFLQTLMTTAVLVAGSTILPVVPNALVTFGFVAAGNMRDLIDTSLRHETNGFTHLLGAVVSVLIPNLRAFDLGDLYAQAGVERGEAIELPMAYLGDLTLQAVFYTTAVLGLAIYLFSRREFA